MRRRAARWSKGMSIVALLSLALTACAGGAQLRPAAIVHPEIRTVDLSHVVREDVPYPPDEPPTRLVRDSAGRLSQLTIGSDTGSLLRVMAAPGAEPASVETLSPRDLVLPAVVIDARDQAQDRPAFALGVADVLAWERTHGQIAAGTLVLLATGWDVRWGDPDAYQNPGPDGTARTPGFDHDAADLLLNQREVAGLGVDAPAVAHPPATGSALLLENLTNLEQLPATGATIIIGALKLQAAESSPARVLALVP